MHDMPNGADEPPTPSQSPPNVTSRTWSDVVEAIPLPAAIADGEYRYVAVNAPFCALLSRERTALEGQIDTHALGNDLAKRLRRAVLQALADGQGELELSADDSIDARSLMVKARPLNEPQPTVMIVVMDHSAQKRTEEQLRLTAERFHTLAALSQDWYWEQDENLRFCYFSSEAQHKAQIPIVSALGCTRFELDHEWPSEQAREAHARTLAERHPFRNLALTERRSGRLVLLSGEPVFDHRGVFRGYRGVGRDVSALQRAQEQVLQLRDLYAVMMQANLAVSRSTSAEELFSAVCTIAVQHGHFAHARVAEIDPYSGAVHTVASMGEPDVPAELLQLSLDPRLPEGRTPAAHALRAGGHYVCDDVLREAGSVTSSVQLARTGLRAYAVLPMQRQGKISGLLQVFAQRT
ncbi:MAG: GAF domain-containing protein, partial [Burkholderiales bacterium]|nr:GAF domain-containing protein [Burkholderiales bacterium]